MAPFGILAPNLMYWSGFFKKFTNSMISIFASSQPATSLQMYRTYGKCRQIFFLTNLKQMAKPKLT